MKYKWTKAWNLIRAYGDLLLGREQPRAYPVELSLGTTSFCNLKCIQCPREDNENNRLPYNEHLSLEYFQSMENYIKQAKDVYLYGLGEPMIDNDYFEKVRYVASFGSDVSLSSNGTLLNEKRCRETIESGIKSIGISLDAATEKTFEVVRPPGGLPDIIENVKRLCRMKKEMGASRPVVKLSFGIMRQNVDEIPLFPDLAAEIGVDEIVMHPVIYMSQQAKESMQVDRKLIEEKVEIARQSAEKHGIPFSWWYLDPMTYLMSLDYENMTQIGTPAHLKPKEANGKPKKKQFCFFLWRNAMVQGEGEVFPCCYMTNIKLGKVQNGNLNEVRGHPTLNDMRKGMFEGEAPTPCRSCPQMQPYDRWHIFKSGLQEIKNLLRRD